MTDQPIEPLATGRESASKRLKNIGHPEFGTSPARQAAAVAWGSAEVAAELRENTDALQSKAATLEAIADAMTRQADAAERTAAAAERTASLTQITAMLALYSTPEQMLPGGVRDQFKTALGIRAADTTPAVPTAPSVSPQAPTAVVTVPTPAPDVDEFV